jgi:hypothetical protein
VTRTARKHQPDQDLPVFSERLTEVLEAVFKGEAPNVGYFCGYCYTPLDRQRTECPHCRKSTSDYAPVEKVPSPVLQMFQDMRRRESLVVNSFAYLGLFSGVAIFIIIFYALFLVGANFWWYVVNIVMLFVLARVLAGILGGYFGDEIGYRRSRRKLAEEWQAYEAQRVGRTKEVA